MAEITIYKITAADHDEVLDFLRLHYYQEEPLTVGFEPKRPDKSDEEFTMSNIQYGTCLMAVQNSIAVPKSNGRGKIVGALMAGPKEATPAAQQFDNSKWGRISKFLTFVERQAHIFQRFNVEQTLHTHVMGVDAQVRGQSIGAKLILELMVVGKKLGYSMLTIDCTSLYSAKLCEKLDMECINCIYYADYKDESGEQVFKPPKPHDCVKTYVKKLILM